MGAKDVRSSFLGSSSALSGSLTLKPQIISEDSNNNVSDPRIETIESIRKNWENEERKQISCALIDMQGEWEEKFGFLIGLLRKPHSFLNKKSLEKGQLKVRRRLSASRRQRSFLSTKIQCDGPENDVEKAAVVSQLKHLDIMCQTLERQIDVLSHVNRVIPSNHESVYSGDPDSLDGTSSELMMLGDEDEDHLRSPHFTIIQNPSNSSPVDPLTMLHLERSAHMETRQELCTLKKRFEVLRDEFDSGEGMSETTSLLFDNQLDERELSRGGPDDVKTFNSTRDRRRLESGTDITKLHNTLVQLERVRDELTLQNVSLKRKLSELSARISDTPTYQQDKLNNNSTVEENGQIHLLSPNDVKSGNQTSAPETDEMKLKRKSTYKVSHPKDECGTEIHQLRSLIKELQMKEGEALRQLAQSGSEVNFLRGELEVAEIGRREGEHACRVLEDQLNEIEKRLEATERCFLTRDEEHSALKLDLDTLKEENGRLKEQLHQLHHQVEKEQCQGIERLCHFEKEIDLILNENKTLRVEVGRERLLRKRYYNIVEEMKGKIRVFCRIRPLSRNEEGSEPVVAKSSDPYTVTVETSKGIKEFQFDRVFLPEDSQEQVFSDTRKLIQSAFDGFNVCCVSYGQTGSGKTYTILGDEKQPGIAPRTFNEIFSLAADLKHSFETKISFYMLELYNDKLIDLLNPHSSANNNPLDSPDTNKLEIKRDRSGTVWISGARVLIAESSGALEKTFRQAVGGRHTATTRMNDRSSRSHLIIGLIIETTSRNNGTLLRGKISLLDLAGSERTGKSGVSAENLREANAINKSLSALGDVINALNTEQPFIPYRNNKLTLLMQDSIGGNAKTLMFVNISPVGSNVDETVVSLTYASRVKQVTNGATRNAESKEITRLRNVITRLKRGEQGSAEDDTL